MAPTPMPESPFPSVPRPAAQWRWWLLLIAVVLTVSMPVYVYFAPTAHVTPVLGALVLTAVSFAGVLWLIKPALSSRIWRKAVIVPARVVREPSAGLVESGPEIEASILGVLFHVIVRHIYNPGETSGRVEFVLNGEHRVASFRAVGFEEDLVEGDLLWVALHGPPGRVIPADRIAPDAWFGLGMSKPVAQWLIDSLDAAQEASRKAPDSPAAAATKLATRYSRRPS